MSERAILAAGCFWGVEKILKEIDGVINTTVGYIGGKSTDPTYADVCSGTTGHAEAVEVEFDPEIITYEKVLNYFWRLHDPTTLNQQHNDRGTQYRSAIFYTSEEQKKIAEQSRSDYDQSGILADPIVTEISPLTTFYPAEEYHQDYLDKNPGGYMCHILRDK